MSEPAGDVLPGDQITLEQVLRLAWRDRWIIVISTAVLAGVTAAGAFLVTPKYAAEVVMIPVKADDARAALSGMVGQLGGIGSLAGFVLPSGGNKDEYLAYLQSNRFTARFLEDEQLLPVLFAKLWDPRTDRWDVDDPDDVPTLADGVKEFSRRVRAIQEERRTGIVTLSVVWSDPEVAAHWANLMVDRVNRDLRQRAIAESEASIEYLNGELAKTNVVEVQQAIYRLIENEIKSVMLANVRQEYAFKVIDPAVAADKDDVVRPKKLAMILLGAMFGAGFGFVFALWRWRWAGR